jgi:autotransporter family porin
MPSPPVGRLLGDAAAARRVRRSSWEPRPANRAVNRRMPTRSELRAFRRATRLPPRLRRRVTGHFTGTTDETIQWAAWKWGIAPDLLRAQATVESWWRMSAVGDRGQSFGLMQIRRTHRGTFPLSRRSTAFNVDYAAAVLRYYYDGNAGWMAHESENATAYRRGDLWGSVGAWYSGRWHTAPSEEYIARVHDHMVDRTWRRPGF